jgi:hydroxyacylglutathione hydrolase
MRVFSIIVGPLEANCYVLANQSSGEAILIDPGDESAKILKTVQANSLNVKYILNTHGHIDHIGANVALRKKLNARIAIHSADADLLRNSVFNGAALFGVSFTEHAPDLLLRDGQVIELSSLKLTVLHTPGHTPGSVCFLGEDCIFTGDTLFAGGVGRTDLQGGSWSELCRSLKEKILPLPDALIVYPGHGADSTLAEERRSNPFLLELKCS